MQGSRNIPMEIMVVFNTVNGVRRAGLFCKNYSNVSHVSNPDPQGREPESAERIDTHKCRFSRPLYVSP